MPPPLIFVGGLLLGIAPNGIFPRPFVPKGMSRALGLPLLMGGAFLAAWFARTMRRAGTPFRLDEPATKLVTDGPFRYSRNPGYLSFAMIQAGASLLLGRPWGVVLVPATMAVIRHRVIEREEGYLERAFGDEYLRYKASVGRWL